MCALNFSPSQHWKVTNCPDWIYLTSKSNFSIGLLLDCHGLESNASRFDMEKNGQSNGDPSCKLCGAALEDVTSFCHAPFCKLNIGSCLATPLQLWDINLPDPASEPDIFASIILRINWIDDIEIQVFCINFLAELKAFRAKLIQL